MSFEILTVPSSSTYTIEAPAAATSSATTGSGTATYQINTGAAVALLVMVGVQVHMAHQHGIHQEKVSNRCEVFYYNQQNGHLITGVKMYYHYNLMVVYFIGTHQQDYLVT